MNIVEVVSVFCRRFRGDVSRIILPSDFPLIKVVVIFGTFFSVLPSTQASNWSEPAEVLWNYQPVVTYRAKLDGGFLVVEADHRIGWHTYAMDNKIRAREKLSGKQSLGIDSPTIITTSGGLEVSELWYQSPPHNYSKPELRWFTWGFQGRVMFVVPVTEVGVAPAKIVIRGQACDERSCRNIELDVLVPSSKVEIQSPGNVDLEKLVKVRREGAVQGH